MSWPPESKISAAMGTDWPISLRELAEWAAFEAPSIYLLRCAREIVENLIRADASDAIALENVRQLSGSAASYSAESIGQKMEALQMINVRIAALGLDRPVNVGWQL